MRTKQDLSKQLAKYEEDIEDLEIELAMVKHANKMLKEIAVLSQRNLREWKQVKTEKLMDYSTEGEVL